MRPAEGLEIEVIPRTPPANGTVTMRTWIVSESTLAIREHCRRNDAERASIVSRNERYFGPTEMFSGTASCWLCGESSGEYRCNAAKVRVAAAPVSGPPPCCAYALSLGLHVRSARRLNAMNSRFTTRKRGNLCAAPHGGHERLSRPHASQTRSPPFVRGMRTTG